jgi:hypothetical protein
MKKLLLLALVLTTSLGYAQEMKLPDDKKKKYAKEEVKKEEVNTVRTVETERREQVAKVDEKKEGAPIANYCIIRESGNAEHKKFVVEVENDFSAMERVSDENRVKLKEMMGATTNVQYKTAIQALNALAVQGYRVSSTLTYQSGENIVKEYIMLRTE